ncbi:hypothetical protein K4O81_08810 [Staphylococcus epidermidis]|nr:hypothetical protein [Staphylococcus epidermidis]
MKDIFNEMDYRNIPRDMLDKNIPTGRGMVKWAPFVIYMLKNIDYFV